MGALFNTTAGVKLNHVAYRGVEPAMQDTIGGHVPMTFIAVSNAMPAHEAGQVQDPGDPGAAALRASCRTSAR